MFDDLVEISRKRKGRTQEELARRVGISKRTLERQLKNPDDMRVRTAKKLCDVLGISISTLNGAEV